MAKIVGIEWISHPCHLEETSIKDKKENLCTEFPPKSGFLYHHP